MINTSTINFIESVDGQDVYEVKVSKNRDGEHLEDIITVEVPAGFDTMDTDQQANALEAFQKALIEKERNYHRENQMILESEKAEKAEKAKKAVSEKIELLKNAGLTEAEIMDLIQG